MNEQDISNLHVSIANIEYRLEIIEAQLGITGVYMDIVEAQKILNG